MPLQNINQVAFMLKYHKKKSNFKENISQKLIG